MKITKFVHSCLLVETNNLKVLIDPGNFTWHSRLLSVDKLPRLDYLVLTHAHSDHYHQPFVSAIRQKFPHLPIVTNNDLAAKLQSAGVSQPISTGSEDGLQVFEAAHEPLPLDLPNVLNIGIHIGDKFTTPGDSFSFSHSRDVLALPMTGPWGSLKDALKKVVELKPKVVIPVHDWEWHKAARKARYEMSQKLLEPHGIKFVTLENAEPVEI
jgi:L-ascorbate metabolism protein UlaG (beta-lactamase superfamily)